MCGPLATMDQEEIKTRRVSGTHRYASAVVVPCLTLCCSHDASDQTATAHAHARARSLIALSLARALSLSLLISHTHNLASACRLTCLFSTPFCCFRKDKNGIADLTMKIGTTANQRGESTLQRMNQMCGLNGNERKCRALCSVLCAMCYVRSALRRARRMHLLCAVLGAVPGGRPCYFQPPPFHARAHSLSLRGSSLCLRHGAIDTITVTPPSSSSLLPLPSHHHHHHIIIRHVGQGKKGD